MEDPANNGVGVKALMVKTEFLAVECCKGKDWTSVFIRYVLFRVNIGLQYTDYVLRDSIHATKTYRQGQGSRTDAINISVALCPSDLRGYICIEMRAGDVRTFKVSAEVSQGCTRGLGENIATSKSW